MLHRPSHEEDSMKVRQPATSSKTGFFDLPLEIRIMIPACHPPPILWLKSELFNTDKYWREETWTVGLENSDYRYAYNH